MMTDTSLTPFRTLLDRVASRTLRFDMSEWFWGDAIAIDGLLDAAELLEKPEYEAAAAKWLKRWADRFLTRGPIFTDHLVPGGALVTLHQKGNSDGPWLDAAKALASYLHNDVPRAHGSHAPLYRPDDPAYRQSVWVDSLYHEPPFFAALAAATGDPRYADWALQVTLEHWAVLYDEKRGLLPQAIDTATGAAKGWGWARGMGWALLGLADTLHHLPNTQRAKLEPLTLDLAQRVADLQDITGFWHTVINDREAYLETSTAAFFGAAYLRLARSGQREWLDNAASAKRALLGRIDGDGAVWGVSAVTWAATSPGPDVNRYKVVPTEFNLWGQGSAMRLLSEAIRFENRA